MAKQVFGMKIPDRANVDQLGPTDASSSFAVHLVRDDIGWFYVSMERSVMMQLPQGGKKLHSNEQRFLNGKDTLLKTGTQRSA